ncbi:MAG: ATP-binding protein [Myxococcaceae bacterium]|nr:ATP-binding protein [Myxococcaceae bacterium]
MKQQLSFETDAAIVTRLGRELVARQETALVELVKNGFDADATEVNVRFVGSGDCAAIEIRDNGSGMTRDELIAGFLRLAGDGKVRAPRSPRFNRQRAGRKGIGRFATQRLGDHLSLVTSGASSDSSLRLTVNWTQFVAGKTLADVKVDLEEIPRDRDGTFVRITGLRDAWTDAQIRRCWRGVLALQQPFPVKPISPGQELNPAVASEAHAASHSLSPKLDSDGTASKHETVEVDPGFEVKFVRDDEQYGDESVVADLQTEILNHLHVVVELKVDSAGEASWCIAKNRFGKSRDWTRIHAEHRDSRNPPSYEHIKNVWMKTYYVILLPELLPSLVFSRIRDVLSESGGVRLYRNGFRVIPYGEPGDDWLGLDEKYAKRSVLVPAANRNFFGVVEVNDPAGETFDENTSREGLIQNPAFLELRALISAVLETAVICISDDRGTKARAGSRPTASLKGSLDAVVDALKSVEEAAKESMREPSSGATELVVAQATNAVLVAEAAKVEMQAAEARLADEKSMLRYLATLGMTTAEFSHETGMTFDAFRIDFECVFSAATDAQASNPLFLEQAHRAHSMLSRLDTLTSYLNALAAARSARSMSPVSLTKSVKDFERGVRLQAESQSISLTVDLPAFDPMFTSPMHPAELASILLNFYTNAVKAMKRSKAARRVLIVADRVELPESRLRLRFCDTGDGIPEVLRERVFDAFFTTRVAAPSGETDIKHATGTGLGLWIVSQIVSNVGGEVLVTDPPQGFSTCFELLLQPEVEDD